MEHALKLTEDNLDVVARETGIKAEEITHIRKNYTSPSEEHYFIVENLGDPTTRRIAWLNGELFKVRYEFIEPEDLTKFIQVKKV